MEVKAVDIAKALGISKATVSLALNNKPGVSEKTRKLIFDTKEQLEQISLPEIRSESVQTLSLAQEIKVVLISRGMHSVRDGELDLWTDVKAVFEKYARENGYALSLLYIDYTPEDIATMIRVCNSDSVAGVIVSGTELGDGDEKDLEKIRKPLVIYDTSLPTEKYSSVMINNRQGIQLAVDELVRKQHSDIVYICNDQNMYNFSSRERGFREAMAKHSLPVGDGQVIRGGDSIQTCSDFLRDYLERRPLPDAFICGTYHTSIALFRVLAERGTQIPRDVSVIGVDALPSYLTGGIPMTAVRVPHTERAYWTMQLLFKDMRDPSAFKIQLYMNCRLVQGKSVAARHLD